MKSRNDCGSMSGLSPDFHRKRGIKMVSPQQLSNLDKRKAAMTKIVDKRKRAGAY